MKMILFLLFSIPILLNAQDSLQSKLVKENVGIHFEKRLSWKEIISKAKSEGKYIFIDCYATWCGPCKFMTKNIFPQQVVGDFMNEKFISLAVQMDETSKDDAETKSWYADAQRLGKEFSIEAYPTYLFFDSYGRPVHRVAGSTGKDAKDFVSIAADALDSNKQYYTRLEKIKTHKHDSIFLRTELIAALKSGDAPQNAESIANIYFDCIQDKSNSESINLFRLSMQSSKDRAFDFFLNNASIVDSALAKKGEAVSIVSSIIANEEIVSLFEDENSIKNWEKIKSSIKRKLPLANVSKGGYFFQVFESEIVSKELQKKLEESSVVNVNWAALANYIRRVCPGYDPDSIIILEKPNFYRNKKMWTACDKATLTCLRIYGNKLGAYDLNNIIWDNVFLHSSDMILLSLSIELQRRIIPDSSGVMAGKKEVDFGYIDTYANVLYKAGMKDLAILWEKTALKVANSGRFQKEDETNLRITISKMENGESTWVGRDGHGEFTSN